MVGATTLAIASAGRNQTNVTANEQSAQALAAAEAGVARIQSILIQYPELAVLNGSDWQGILNGTITADDLNALLAARDSSASSNVDLNNVVVSDMGTFNIKTTSDNIFAFLSNEIILAKADKKPDSVPPGQAKKDDGDSSGGQTGDTQQTQNSGGGSCGGEELFTEQKVGEIKTELQGTGIFNDVNSDNIFDPVTIGGGSGGSFQFMGYQYDNAKKMGTLLIDGNSSQGLISLAVDIPATLKGNSSFESGELEGVPALWITDGNNSFGNNKISGNVKISSPTCKTVAQLGDDAPGTSNLINGGTLEISSEPMPETPALPSSGSTGFYTITTNITGDETFPRTSDSSDADGYYHYLIPDVTYSGNHNLFVSANAKVILYVQGDFNIGGSSDVTVPDSSQLQIYGNTDLGNGSYKYGCNLVDTSNCGTDTVLIRGGTASGNIFIHAVDAEAGVNGGGGVDPNFKGSIWAKTWDASSANTVAVGSQGNYGDYLSGKGRTVSAPPSIEFKNASNWRRQAK